MPPRACARPAERSSSSATASSGPGGRLGAVPGAAVGIGSRVGGLGERGVQPRGARRATPSGRPPSAPAGGGSAPARRTRAGPASTAGVAASGRDPELLGRAPDEQRLADRVGRRELQQPPRVGRESVEPPPEAVLDAGERPGRRREAEAARQLGRRSCRAAAPAAPADCRASRRRSGRGRASSSGPGTTVVEQRARVGSSASPRSASSGRPASSRSSPAPARRRQAPPTPRAAGARRTRAPARRPRRATGSRRRRRTAAAPRRRRTAGRAPPARRGSGPERRPARGPNATPQRVALGLGERVEPVEHRRAQLVQPRVRQLHLRLDARDAGDPESGRLVGGVAQQRRLADPGLAADDEHRALPAAHVLEQPVQLPRARPIGPAASAGARQSSRSRA